jgi:hypothetical protein
VWHGGKNIAKKVTAVSLMLIHLYAPPPKLTISATCTTYAKSMKVPVSSLFFALRLERKREKKTSHHGSVQFEIICGTVVEHVKEMLMISR